MRKGQQHSEETKAKIAAAKEGKTFTPEHCAAIAFSLKDKKKTAAHKRAISEGIKAAHALKVGAIIDPALVKADVPAVPRV